VKRYFCSTRNCSAPNEMSKRSGSPLPIITPHNPNTLRSPWSVRVANLLVHGGLLVGVVRVLAPCCPIRPLQPEDMGLLPSSKEPGLTPAAAVLCRPRGSGVISLVFRGPSYAFTCPFQVPWCWVLDVLFLQTSTLPSLITLHTESRACFGTCTECGELSGESPYLLAAKGLKPFP
jgi:hypothetical protein